MLDRDWKLCVTADNNRHTSGPATSLRILYHHRTRSRDGQSVHIDEMIGALRGAGHSVQIVGPQRVDAMRTSRGKRLLPRFLYELLEFGYSAFEFLKLASAVLKTRPHAIYERAN